MLITRSTDKPAQQSHNIGTVESNAISDIHEAADDGCILWLCHTFTVFLNSSTLEPQWINGEKNYIRGLSLQDINSRNRATCKQTKYICFQIGQVFFH